MESKLVYRLFLVAMVILGVVILSWTSVNSAVPYGANITEIDTEMAPLDQASNHTAHAGNVTEMDVFGYTTTQTWQGYFGNVSGVIQLADAADNVMYNWTLASPEGEVYASINSSVVWADIQCFNYTATGAYGAEVSTRGQTSLIGKNLSQLEAEYNITWDDVDGVNETFSVGNGHDEFFTNNLNFTYGECPSTMIYDNSGKGVDNHFEEVILYSPGSGDVVFASILDEEDVFGFDNRTHDFEMLVLENGHNMDVDGTNYYFYVELE